MKIKTLLNKLKLNNNQTIRVLDEKSNYFIESTNKKTIVEDCGQSSVVHFGHINCENCFLIYINKKRSNQKEKSLESVLDNISNMTDEELKEYTDVVINKEDKWIKETKE